MRNYDNYTSTKLIVKKHLLDFLYHPAEKKLEDRLVVIARSFSLDSKCQSMAFMYKGNIYYPEGYRPVRGLKAELLSKRLYDQMDAWLILRKELDQEIEVISDFLSCLLTASHNTADIKALLPDCLIGEVTESGDINPPPTLTTEEIQAFNETHKEYIQTIKERIVLNMIT